MRVTQSMTESYLTNEYVAANSERHVPNPALRKWNQSVYFNFYDPVKGLGRNRTTLGFHRASAVSLEIPV